MGIADSFIKAHESYRINSLAKVLKAAYQDLWVVVIDLNTIRMIPLDRAEGDIVSYVELDIKRQLLFISLEEEWCNYSKSKTLNSKRLREDIKELSSEIIKEIRRDAMLATNSVEKFLLNI